MSFEAVCVADQVDVREEPGGEVFIVVSKISETYMENERICLS